MKVVPLAIPDVLRLEPVRHGDKRGCFVETYNARTLAPHLGDLAFVQDNQSRSAAPGTVRGLHFQTAPHAQAKLVRVLHGAILDVAVDIRRGSPSFGRHVSAVLTAEDMAQLFVPAGFAHGFRTLEPDTVVAYKTSAFYAPDCDRGILWHDPDLGIDWGLAPDEAVTSDKDKSHPRLRDAGMLL